MTELWWWCLSRLRCDDCCCWHGSCTGLGRCWCAAAVAVVLADSCACWCGGAGAGLGSRRLRRDMLCCCCWGVGGCCACGWRVVVRGVVERDCRRGYTVCFGGGRRGGCDWGVFVDGDRGHVWVGFCRFACGGSWCRLLLAQVETYAVC